MRWVVGILLIATSIGLFWLFRHNSKPDLAAPYRYAVEDIDKIGSIKIDYRLIDPDISLQRRDGFWELNGRYRAREDAIENLLAAIHKIELRFIPRPAGKITMIRDLATTGTKIEIFDRSGRLLKAYFIGGSTPDERGTFAIMAGTDEPAVVSLAGFEGTIRPRFIMPEIEWRDRLIFRENPDKIDELKVHYPSEPEASFVLRKSEGKVEVFPLMDDRKVESSTPRPGAVEAYLENYKSVGAESIFIDPVLQAQLESEQPFATLSIRRADHSNYQVELFPVSVPEDASVRQQIERYYVLDSEGNLFLVQHRVFQKLFLGLDYFLGNPVDS